MRNVFFVMVGAALLLSCNKIGTDDNIQTSFKIYLQDANTKTVNDGLSTKWVNGDRLMVYHAVAGTTDYVKDGNGRYNITDSEKGEATPVTAPSLSDGLYDWYVYYQWNSKTTVPKSHAQIIVHSPGTSLTQTGNNSMSHLAGTFFPLYGIAKSVKASESPTVHMKNIVTVFEFKIKCDLPLLLVKKIELEAPENLVGSFFINYSGEDPVLEPNGTMVSNSAVLDVTAPEVIMMGNSASFYLGTAPFTLESGKELTIKVTVSDGDNDGIQTFHLSTSENLDFKSGKIRPFEITVKSIS